MDIKIIEKPTPTLSYAEILPEPGVYECVTCGVQNRVLVTLNAHLWLDRQGKIFNSDFIRNTDEQYRKISSGFRLTLNNRGFLDLALIDPVDRTPILVDFDTALMAAGVYYINQNKNELLITTGNGRAYHVFDVNTNTPTSMGVLRTDVFELTNLQAIITI